MKQRIRVVGIIRNENGVLILKRNRGRSETPVFWELPTGKIKFGEQPEEAMARSLADYTGLTARTITLRDVITFLALEDSSRLSNLYIVYEITTNPDKKPSPRDRYTSYKYIKDLHNNSTRLNEASLSVMEIIEGKTSSSRASARDTASSATVYVDGASRGNPGPSGIGRCIVNNNGEIIERDGEFIGFATSRIAEYQAMRSGIERAIELGLKSARFMSDSLMVVNQLNGIFKVKNNDIRPIYNEIIELMDQFEAISFTHISRSENVIADSEANRAINSLLKK